MRKIPQKPTLVLDSVKRLNLPASISNNPTREATGALISKPTSLRSRIVKSSCYYELAQSNYNTEPAQNHQTRTHSLSKGFAFQKKDSLRPKSRERWANIFSDEIPSYYSPNNASMHKPGLGTDRLQEEQKPKETFENILREQSDPLENLMKDSLLKTGYQQSSRGMNRAIGNFRS